MSGDRSRTEAAGSGPGAFCFLHDPGLTYPAAPFDPPRDYPEFGERPSRLDPANGVYAAVRELLLASGLDAPRARTPNWNPMRGLVKDGDLVLIKPNLVLHESAAFRGTGAITTHGSLFRPLLDYLWLLGETDAVRCRVVIADVPLQSASFEKILGETGIGDLAAFVNARGGLDLEVIDLRREIAQLDDRGYITSRRPATGDPRGYVAVRLDRSFLDDIIQYADRFSIGDYDDARTREKHSTLEGHHYLISRTVLEANLVINASKIKTHCKAGITAAMKNLIGINGDKSWIPHHRTGSPRSGGDEYSDELLGWKRLHSAVRRRLQGRSRVLWGMARTLNRRLVRPLLARSEGASRAAEADHRWRMDGSWPGNDTLWRPILDLHRILELADPAGAMTGRSRRRILCLGDGIVAGEGDGPLRPVPRAAGLLTLAEHPVVHDFGCARLMGFDEKKLPFLREALAAGLAPADLLTSVLGCGREPGGDWREYRPDELPNLHFRAPSGWRGQMERP